MRMKNRVDRCGKRLAGRVIALLLCLMLLSLPVFAAGEGAELAIPVSVSVAGETDGAAGSFTVRLTAAEHAPLPARKGNGGAEYAELTVKAGETALFPSIVYPTVGVYRYTLSETSAGQSDMRLDAAVYTVTVTVMNAEDGGLRTALALTKDGKKQENASFRNEKLPKPSPDKLIQTGQENGLVWLLGIAGALLLLLGVLTERKSRRTHR